MNKAYFVNYFSHFRFIISIFILLLKLPKKIVHLSETIKVMHEHLFRVSIIQVGNNLCKKSPAINFLIET